MAAWRVELRPAAVRDLKALPRAVQVRLAHRIEALGRDPFPRGSIKLSGVKGDFHRLRVGDYRVIYQARGDILLVLVVGVADRKEVYRRLRG